MVVLNMILKTFEEKKYYPITKHIKIITKGLKIEGKIIIIDIIRIRI